MLTNHLEARSVLGRCILFVFAPAALGVSNGCHDSATSRTAIELQVGDVATDHGLSPGTSSPRNQSRAILDRPEGRTGAQALPSDRVRPIDPRRFAVAESRFEVGDRFGPGVWPLASDDQAIQAIKPELSVPQEAVHRARANSSRSTSGPFGQVIEYSARPKSADAHSISSIDNGERSGLAPFAASATASSGPMQVMPATEPSPNLRDVADTEQAIRSDTPYVEDPVEPQSATDTDGAGEISFYRRENLPIVRETMKYGSRFSGLYGNSDRPQDAHRASNERLTTPMTARATNASSRDAGLTRVSSPMLVYSVDAYDRHERGVGQGARPNTEKERQ